MEKLICTFSIVAYDSERREWGVGVASKFLAAGGVVPYVQAEIGAIATQALANLTYGPDGLSMLSEGKPAQEVVDALVAADDMAAQRQLGVVDAQGRAATFTGDECFDWAGGITGEGFTIQGNILTGPEVVEAMRDAYLDTQGDLADRILASLLAGDRAGGDSRGRQSAGILVCRHEGGYFGMNDRALDLRVDDHVDPIPELIRLVGLHRLYLQPPRPEDIIDIDEQVGAELASILVKLGAVDSADGFGLQEQAALKDLMGIENLEMRWVEDGKIDKIVLDHLRRKALP